MSFLTFNVQALGESVKTQRWTVLSQSASLGEISWYSAWRRYAFHPSQGTVFDAACLAEVTEFLTAETERQKATWK